MITMYRNPLANGEYRNHPCICGSGKKMKKCHGRDYSITSDEFKAIRDLGRQHNERVREFNEAIITHLEADNEKSKGDTETLSDAEVLAQDGPSGAQGSL